MNTYLWLFNHFYCFWPLNDQITVSFVRAAGVLAKGRMPHVWHACHKGQNMERRKADTNMNIVNEW